jgi:hypothetical protein
MVLFIDHNHEIHIRYASPIGTNNCAELIDLWNLLEIKKGKGLRKFQVLGDCKLVFDWAQDKVSIQNTKLATVMREIMLEFQSFE